MTPPVVELRGWGPVPNLEDARGRADTEEVVMNAPTEGGEAGR